MGLKAVQTQERWLEKLFEPLYAVVVDDVPAAPSAESDFIARWNDDCHKRDIAKMGGKPPSTGTPRKLWDKKVRGRAVGTYASKSDLVTDVVDPDRVDDETGDYIPAGVLRSEVDVVVEGDVL